MLDGPLASRQRHLPQDHREHNVLVLRSLLILIDKNFFLSLHQQVLFLRLLHITQTLRSNEGHYRIPNPPTPARNLHQPARCRCRRGCLLRRDAKEVLASRAPSARGDHV